MLMEGGLGSGFLGGVGIFSLGWDRMKILFQVCLEIFFNKICSKFFNENPVENFPGKIRLGNFRHRPHPSLLKPGGWPGLADDTMRKIQR